MPNSQDKPSQLPLELPHLQHFGRDDLIVGEANQLAVDMIDRWPNWSSQLVVLAGPVGSGKSHLTSIWVEKANARLLEANDIGNISDEISAPVNFAIENIAAGNFDETTLFHLLNLARQRGGHGLLTSSQWPQSWNFQLPDLSSRLRAATLVELSEPDDLLLRQTMIKLFSDRQLLVDRQVIDYLVVRMERSLGAARKIVTLLDSEALARNRPVTRPMAAKVLQQIAEGKK